MLISEMLLVEFQVLLKLKEIKPPHFVFRVLLKRLYGYSPTK